MGKGLRTGLVFLVGVATGYCQRKYGVKPTIRFSFCEDRPRYFTNPWKIYFNDYSNASKAREDLKSQLRAENFVTEGDWVHASCKHAGRVEVSPGVPFNFSPIHGWESLDTLRIKARKGSYILEIADMPKPRKSSGNTDYCNRYSFYHSTLYDPKEAEEKEEEETDEKDDNE